MIRRCGRPETYRSQAIYSDCERYRYSLIWRGGPGPMLLFVMLNPSGATELWLDPTVRRCLVRARRDRYAGVAVANVFGYRATDPDELHRVADPVGVDNDRCIRRLLAASGAVICGWGNHASIRRRPERAQAILAMIRAAGHRPTALKINADGSPAHPLYLAYARRPVPLGAAGC